jgi:Mrp family chromosome partitioning ATPase
MAESHNMVMRRKMITNEQVMGALRQVMHPELKRNLVELKMIRDVAVQEDHLGLALVLPFKEIPIKDDLVRNVRSAVEALDPGLQVEVRTVEMSQRERAAFMTEADGGPKTAQSVNKVNRVLAVLSGKGGVGKSSVAALLAVALHRQGNRVGVLDADITGPSIPKMFGLHQQPSMGPIGILPAETETGIEVMSINLLLSSEDEAVIWRGPLISGAIKQFWTEVAWGKLDYLIVDLPPGTSDASLTVMQSIPLNGIVLVTSPQDLAGMVVRKAARMAQHMGAPIVGVVENMSYITCPKCGERIEVFGPSQAQNTAVQLGLPLLGRLPLDPELARRCDAGEIEAYSAEAFKPIADDVAKRLSVLGMVSTPSR